VLARLFLTVVVLAALAGLAIRRVNSQLDIALGTLTDHVPEGSAAVTFLLSDARAAFDPFLLARQPDEATAGDWIGANLIGGNPAVQTQTALVRAFADSTRLVGWTHQGFTAVTRKAMSRELEKAVMKARSAGAAVNIVAQGPDAAVVIETLQRSKAGANKVILLGVNTKHLKLDNVAQLAELWSTREIGSSIQIKLIGGRHDGETLDLEALWPGLSTGGDSVDKSMRLVRAFIESPKTLDQLIEEQQALVRDEQFKKSFAAETRAKAAADAVPARIAVPATAPASPAPFAADPPAARPAKAASADREGWATASLLDYYLPDKDTGWLFSGPADQVQWLGGNRTDMTLTLLMGQCSHMVRLAAFPASRLGPGDHDAAIQALFEKESGGPNQRLVSKIERTRYKGYPASHFDTMGAEKWGREYFVIESGRHLIYLVHTHLDLVNSALCSVYRETYEAIAASIRPAKGA
jgi:hypothetical protein